ncbi:MAG: glycosyltransferase [Alphaproteobacteria bacterium]|nr:glycosyltransferase [Alphaproteobacteria bacterium]MBL7099788.1 glycosyltransferase [Alphaproteobacteria bacterium]
MRIVKIARRAKSYWTQLYASWPGAVDLPYKEQKAWFCSDFFGPVDIWETYLRKAGHDATDIISGIDPLDAAWTREHGSNETGFELLLRQVKALDPEVVVLEAIQSFTLKEIGTLRDQLPKMRALIGVTGYDLRNQPELAAVDVVLTCMPNQVEFVRSAGGKSVLFPWWFDPRILERLPQERTVNYNLSFIGSLDPGPHIHDDRVAFLKRLSAEVDMTIFAAVEKRLWPLALRFASTSSAYGATRILRAVGVDVEQFPSSKIRKAALWSRAPRFPYDRKLYSRIRPSFFGIRMFDLLRQSRTNLNFHIALAGPYAANMRLFEATGVGSCLLTDWKANLVEYFSDDEVVSYRSVDEAIDRARWLSNNPRRAEEIGARGQRRTLDSHGFDKRVPLVEEAIRLALG